MRSKVLSILMAVLLIVLAIPAASFAEEGEEPYFEEQGEGYEEPEYEESEDPYYEEQNYEEQDYEEQDYEEPVMEEPVDAVAKIGDQVFASLQDAINNAHDNDTIELLKDIDLTEHVVIDGKILTLTGGFTVNRAFAGTSDDDGDLFLLKGYSELNLENVTIDGKKTDDFGNPGYSGYGLFYLQDNAKLTMTEAEDGFGWRTTLRNSKSDYGSAVYIDSTNAKFVMYGGVIEECEASERGGAIFTKGTVELKKGQIVNNKAGSEGGAIYVRTADNPSDGGYVIVSGSPYVLGNKVNGEENNIFVNDGTRIYMYDSITGGSVGIYYESEDSQFGTASADYLEGAGYFVSDRDYTLSAELNGTNLVWGGMTPPEPTEYQVNFDLNGYGYDSIQPQGEFIPEGDYAFEPEPAPSEEGYTFKGWYLEPESYNKFDFENTAIFDNVTLYGGWDKDEPEPVIWEFSFDLNGHGDVEIQGEMIVDGDCAYAPEDPSEEGWVFKGWFVDQEGTEPYNFETPVYMNTTVYAKWEEFVPEPTYYTVSYELNGHGSTAPEAERVEEGYCATRPENDPSEEGWIFKGWFVADSAEEFEFETTAIYSDIVLYAKWEEKAPDPVYYSVTFDSNGHGTAPQGQTVEEGQYAKDPGQIKADGFNFLGWFTDTDAQYRFNFEGTTITKDITLYAGWEEIPPEPVYYTVKFSANGHGTAPEKQKVEAGTLAKNPGEIKAEGFTFLGWFTDKAATYRFNFEATAITGNITLYAGWSQNPKQFTVKFDANGHGTAPEAQKVEEGKTVARPKDLSADGYDFNGWSTKKDSFSPFDFDTQILSNITLYANWSEHQTTAYYTVTFTTPFGQAPASQTVESGYKVTRPSLNHQEKGYVFTGRWYNGDKSNVWDFDNNVVKQNIVLSALWSPITYQIKFDPNGGTGNMQNMNCSYNSTLYLSSNKFSRSGYTFAGWNTASDGSGTGYSDSAQIKNLSSTADDVITLYAQWKSLYSVIEGAEGWHVKGSEDPLTFRADGSYAKFTGILVDDVTVSTNNYKSWEGSTYVSLNSVYLNGLTNGTHSLKFMFTDGSCGTFFTVDSSNPHTGDTNSILIWIIIIILCVLIVIVSLILILKKKKY